MGMAPPTESPPGDGCLTCSCIDDLLVAVERSQNNDMTGDVAAHATDHAFCAWHQFEPESSRGSTAGLPATLAQAFVGEAENFKRNWPMIRAAWENRLWSMRAACGYRLDNGSLFDLPDLARRCIEDQALTRIVENAWQARLKASADGNGAPRPNEAHPCQTAWTVCVMVMNAQRVEHAAALKNVLKDRDLTRLLQAEPRLASSIFLIVQHADSLPAFQAEMLEKLDELAKKGMLPARNVAMLTDRVMAKTKKKQHFGTQMSCDRGEVVYRPPLDASREEVDRRRKEVGLPPLEEMERMMAEQFCSHQQR
ncbi:MAG: hypothetical protein D6694_11540 [Gammaproteobacteria bacterium]|nr:MAG: hypothetical protein D6694_11540 [Gammaproteobacteria bacterium]